MDIVTPFYRGGDEGTQWEYSRKLAKWQRNRFKAKLAEYIAVLLPKLYRKTHRESGKQ